MRTLFKVAICVICAGALLVALHFPYDIDQPLTDADLADVRTYYADAYRKAPAAPETPPSEFDTKYEQVAARAATLYDVEGQVRRFAETFGLRNKRVLDIGSGRGYLQDIVEDYTGLDISTSVGRFYHKTFVLGSATAMPFEDDAFDGAWSVWVQEHVPNPEQFLTEARRVVKDDGVILLYTAWHCRPWAAQGYQVRPYSDFDLNGKLIKATIPAREVADDLARGPIRAMRALSAAFGPTTLHYHRLEPNYDTYWQADGDAVNSIDPHEAMLWFTSRGDECLNCDVLRGTARMTLGPLFIRVHKPPSR